MDPSDPLLTTRAFFAQLEKRIQETKQQFLSDACACEDERGTTNKDLKDDSKLYRAISQVMDEICVQIKEDWVGVVLKERNCANRKRVNMTEDDDAQSNDKQKKRLKKSNNDKTECALVQKTSDSAQHDHQSKENYDTEETSEEEPLASDTMLNSSNAIKVGPSTPLTEPILNQMSIPDVEPYSPSIPSQIRIVKFGPTMPISSLADALQADEPAGLSEQMPKEIIPNLSYGPTISSLPNAIQVGPSVPVSEKMPIQANITPNISQFGSMVNSSPVNTIQVGQPVPLTEPMLNHMSIPNVPYRPTVSNSSNAIQVGQPFAVPLYPQMPTQTGFVPNAPNGMQLMPYQRYPVGYYNYQPLSLQTLPPPLVSIVYENVQQILAQIYWNMNTAYCGMLQQQQHRQQPAVTHAQTMHHQYQPQLQQQPHQQPISEALPNQEQRNSPGNEMQMQMLNQASMCINSTTTMSTTTATPTEPVFNGTDNDAFDVELRDAIDYLENIEEDTQEEGGNEGECALDELLNEITSNGQMLPNRDTVSQNTSENAQSMQLQQNNEQFHQSMQLQRSSFGSQSFEHQSVHQPSMLQSIPRMMPSQTIHQFAHQPMYPSMHQPMNQPTHPSTPSELMHFNPMLDQTPHYPPSPSPPPAIFTCPYPTCGLSYRTKRNLTIHVQGRHEGKRPFRCTWPRCTYSSASSSATRLHVRVSHFKLPSTLLEQQRKGIVDERDVRDYIQQVWD